MKSQEVIHGKTRGELRQFAARRLNQMQFWREMYAYDLRLLDVREAYRDRREFKHNRMRFRQTVGFAQLLPG